MNLRYLFDGKYCPAVTAKPGETFKIGIPAERMLTVLSQLAGVLGEEEEVE